LQQGVARAGATESLIGGRIVLLASALSQIVQTHTEANDEKDREENVQ
jgi:hypothetical protein